MLRDLRTLSVELQCPVWPMDYGLSLWVSGLGIGFLRVFEVEEFWQLASWDEGFGWDLARTLFCCRASVQQGQHRMIGAP